jgi:hypothetical protein
MANCRAEEGTSNRRRIKRLPIVESFGIPMNAERPGDGCPAQFCGGMEQLFLSFDRLEPGKPLPIDSRTQHLEQRGLRSGGKPVYNLIALGSLIGVLPLLTAFVLLGKYWRRGLTAGALEG